MRAFMDSLRPSAGFLLLQPQPPPDLLTLVWVLVKVMSNSGVVVGAGARAVDGGGVMGFGVVKGRADSARGIN